MSLPQAATTSAYSHASHQFWIKCDGSTLTYFAKHKKGHLCLSSSFSWFHFSFCVVVESNKVYGFSSPFMLVDSGVVDLISLKPRRRGKRRGSLYFSSAKALRRSRMTRGTRVPPKAAEPTPADFRRVLRFETGSIAGEEDAPADGGEAVQLASVDNTSAEHERRAVDVTTVRSFQIVSHYSISPLSNLFMEGQHCIRCLR